LKKNIYNFAELKVKLFDNNAVRRFEADSLEQRQDAVRRWAIKIRKYKKGGPLILQQEYARSQTDTCASAKTL
jgi:hypothetical protein